MILTMCLPMSALAASTPNIYVKASAKNGDAITVNPRGNVFYIPSAVDITALPLHTSAGADISFANADGSYSGTISSGGTLDLTRAASKDERGVSCYKLTLTVGGNSEQYIFYADRTVATTYITTSKGLSYIEQSKENRDKKAKILIVNEKGDVEYADTADTSSEIKGRGNATFSYYKKPYQIKLSAKTTILGMDKAKTFILLANYTDQSALHNALAFTMGDTLGLKYNIEYNFTNLYIDGEYRGLYMICEKVQIDSARVNIHDLEKDNENANEGVDLESLQTVRSTSGKLINSTIVTAYQYVNGVINPDDISGGYLVELDNNYGTREPCYFTTENGNTYVVKSPEYASRSQVEYIATLFADFEEASYSETGYNSKGKHFSEYIDMESFASMYTVQELMKNWDAYTSSVFFYKDKGDDKLYCGPIWDLDNTLGNIKFDKYFFDDTSYLWAQDGVFQNYHRGFAKNLMKHDEFRKVTAEKYALLYTAVKGYLAEGGWFQTESEKIHDSVMMDRTRWKMYDSDSWLLSSGGYKVGVKFIWFSEYGEYDDTSKDTALGFMRYYLSERAEALKSSIGTPPEGNVDDNTTGTTATTITTGMTSSTTGTDASGPYKPSATREIVGGVCAIIVCVGIIAFVLTRKKK